MSTPQDDRPDTDQNDQDLERIERPMDDPQTRPALDPEADRVEDE